MAWYFSMRVHFVIDYHLIVLWIFFYIYYYFYNVTIKVSITSLPTIWHTCHRYSAATLALTNQGNASLVSRQQVYLLLAQCELTEPGHLYRALSDAGVLVYEQQPFLNDLSTLWVHRRSYLTREYRSTFRMNTGLISLQGIRKTWSNRQTTR